LLGTPSCRPPDSDEAAQPHTLCAFVLQCLRTLPHALRPHIAPALLGPLTHVLGPETPEALLQHAWEEADCGDSSSLQALMQLGLALHVHPWLECYKEQVGVL